MQSVKLRHAQSQSNSSSYVENRTDYSSNYTSNSKRNSSAIYVILPGIGTGVEVIIWCIPHVKFLRGFSVIIFTIANEIVQAFNIQLSYHTRRLMFEPISILHMFSLLVICNIYSFN